MASTFTTLGIEKMATGENAGTWGDKTNTNLDIVNTAISGYVEQAVTSGGTLALSITDGASTATAQNAVIKLTGTITGNSIVTVPDSVEKIYIVTNGTSGAYTVQFKTASGTGITFGVSEKTTKLLYSDGTNIVDAGFSGGGDLEGTELVLDADGDTTLTADTDDQIDIKIAGADDFQFTANTFTAQSGSTIAAQALTATTITASGIVKTDDTTEATSTTDGSLQTDGGLSVAKDAVFGDDVKLLSDSAVLSFGADSDTTLTHTDGTGLTLNGANKLLFRDTGLTIGSNADGDLDIVSDGTAVDSINIESAGGITLDAGTAGSGVIYEDDGTEMFRIFNSSSDVILQSKVSDKDLIIKGNDGGSDVTALTFDMSDAGKATFGGNVVVTGDLTVSGDDITMGTNTAGNILVADGTNFNSIAAGSLSEISTVADDDVFIAVDTSGGGLKKIARSAIVSGLATSGAISNVVDDSTPQLGGDLDMNGQDIVTTSNADLELAPNGTGHVTIRGNTNSGTIQFNCESNSHGQQLKAQAHAVGSSAVSTLPNVTGELVPGKTGGTNFTNSLLVGHATTGTLDAAGQNVGVGAFALDAITSGDNNTAIGVNSLTSVTTSIGNTAIGRYSGNSLATGSGFNTLLGYNSGYNHTTGTDNTAVGTNAIFGTSGQVGSSNTAVGRDALKVVYGDNNIGIGKAAGDNITTGDGNVIIGSLNAGSATGDKQLIIADGVDGSVNWISGDSSGNLTFAADVTLGDDLHLDSDAAVLKFGDDGEITLTHDADVGLKLKHTATADDKPIVLTLQTGETDMAANDVMGAIRFQAPDEGTGTDAILVAAAIQAVSEGDFSSSNNATKLEFHTGASEAASSKMSLSSDGTLTVSHDVILANDSFVQFGDAGEKIEGDGTDLTITSSNDILLDSADNIILDSDTGTLLRDGGTHFATLSSSNGISITCNTSNGDVLLRGNDGGSFITALTLDISEAGAATFNDKVIATELDISGNMDIDGTSNLDVVDIDGATDMASTLAVAGVASFAVAANVAQVAITSSSNAIAWDASAAANAYHITTENTTFSAPSNAVEGAFIAVEINYNGSHTIAFNTVFEFAASTAPTTTDTDGKTDILVFRYNGAVWQEVGRTLNLAES